MLLMVKNLPKLKASFPHPICLCMHRPNEKSSLMAQLISKHLPFPLTEVHRDIPLIGNTLYLAPPGMHMELKDKKTIGVDDGPPVCFSKPSIDILFDSAARMYGAATVGVIVSGMNRDGAIGMKSIENAGGTLLVQDPDEAQMDMMPRSVIDTCSTAGVKKARQIVDFLNTM